MSRPLPPDAPFRGSPCAPVAPCLFTPENQGCWALCCTLSHTDTVPFSAIPTAGFLVFKPELISRLEQGQEPWVLDLKGVEGREGARTFLTGEAQA